MLFNSERVSKVRTGLTPIRLFHLKEADYAGVMDQGRNAFGGLGMLSLTGHKFQVLSILPTSKPLRCSRRPCSINGERHRGLLTGTSNQFESHHDAELLRSPKLQVEDDAHGANPPMGPAGLGGPGSPWPEITECHFAVWCLGMFCGSPGRGPPDFH